MFQKLPTYYSFQQFFNDLSFSVKTEHPIILAYRSKNDLWFSQLITLFWICAILYHGFRFNIYVNKDFTLAGF